ncbi:hypothetical protein [Clostridium sp. FP1]|nr:hypothetical protein [Clostridium sp. FP1]MBZ9637508.1 hypothetical protein [Clostridium sp. FP1]
MSKDIFNKECEARIKLARKLASKCSIEYGREIHSIFFKDGFSATFINFL